MCWLGQREEYLVSFFSQCSFRMASLQTWAEMLSKNRERFMALNHMIVIFCYYDCHILLQRILPIVVSHFLTKQIWDTLLELAKFFQNLTARTLQVKDLHALEEGVVLILCKLERIFCPTFFSVMAHLCVHLPREVILWGPVHSR